MGWNPEEGYYQKHVELQEYSNKITEEQKLYNRLMPYEIKQGIAIASAELAREAQENGELSDTEQKVGKLVDYTMEHKDEYKEFVERKEIEYSEQGENEEKDEEKDEGR